MNNLAIRPRSGARVFRWLATCNKDGVRVTPKSGAAISAEPAQSGSAKSAPVSFFDMLSGASADSAGVASISDSKPQGQSGKHSGGRDSNDPNSSTAGATQLALLSNATPIIPPPIEMNAQRAVLSNPLGSVPNAVPLATNSAAATGTGAPPSSPQLTSSLLNESATCQATPFPAVGTKTAAASSTSEGTPSDQQPQPLQAHSDETQSLHPVNAGAAQVLFKPSPLEPPPVPPAANSMNATSDSTGVTPAASNAGQNPVNPASAPSSKIGATPPNLSTLPLSFNQAISGNNGIASATSNSSRVSNSQSNFGANATNSDSKSAAAAKTDQPNQAATSNGASHNTENNSQQNQNSQADAVQTTVATKTTDVVPSHLISAPAISRPGDAGSSGTASLASDSAAHHSADSGAAVSEPLGAQASAGSPGINAARVIQSMSGTEMRVGMHSSDFGEISIHTTLSQLQLQTQISVNHNELGNTIATHIPAIQAKLGSEHGINASIEVSQTGSSLSGNAGQSSDQRNQKAFAPKTANLSDPAPVDPAYSGLRAPPAAMEGSRLDIRA